MTMHDGDRHALTAANAEARNLLEHMLDLRRHHIADPLARMAAMAPV